MESIEQEKINENKIKSWPRIYLYLIQNMKLNYLSIFVASNEEHKKHNFSIM